MKSRICQLLLLLALLANVHVYAQAENRVWKFGDHFGLYFTNSGPVAMQSNMAVTEGCASVCDSVGNLLFYSDGGSVWDKNDTKMPNGTGLLGNKYGSATQGVVIVRSIANTRQYFLFVLDAEEEVIAQPVLVHGGYLRYSVVDMGLNNGLGDVVSAKKNVLLDSNMSEKMVAVKGGGCNIWLLTHDRSLEQYRVHNINEHGIDNNVVISNTGIHAPGTYQVFPGPYMRGEMKVSPDRRWVGLINTTAPFTELGSFDCGTGVVSNTIQLDSNGTSLNYGIHFSPSSGKLYTSQESPGQVVQYDLTHLPDVAAVRNSKTVIAKGDYGGFRTGPDLKIYMPLIVANIAYIAYVNDPELPGTGCNVLLNSVGVSANNSDLYGLGNPAIVQLAGTVYGSYDSIACGRTATILAPAGYDSYLWSTGSTGQSLKMDTSGTIWVYAASNCGLLTDTFNVFEENTDTITILTDTTVCFVPAVALYGRTGYSTYTWGNGSTGQVYTTAQTGACWYTAQKGCTFLTDTIQVHMVNFSAFMGNDTAICPGDSIEIDYNIEGAAYLWSGGAVGSSYTINSPGVYWVAIQKDNCTAHDTISVAAKKLDVWLGNDTTLCVGVAMTLAAGIEGRYEWQDGSNGMKLLVTAPGTYAVAVHQGKCFEADTITIGYQPCNCPALIPNAFSPNHDGRNDLFGADVHCPYRSYRMRIYNRWGQVVFDAFNESNKWDGSYKNVVAETGVYYYALEIAGPDGEPYFYKGDVTLIR